MDNCVVISGASKGIGRASAALFQAAGYRVVNLSRSTCPVPDVENIAVDLMQPDWTEQFGAAIRQAVGQPEQLVIIHNAALLTNDTYLTLDPQRLREVMELNVVAPVVLNQLLATHMGEGSSILYVGSTLGEKAVPNSCAYVSSKHALVGLMRSTCQDMKGSGQHTACICPGFTDTEMLRSHIGEDESIVAALSEGVVLGRLVEPEEIAKTLLFAAENPVLNGAVLHANLGQVES
jgi:NAD(P)-dependent dehydrogenase (short-subunit alcohol dehydrogenase family)